MVKVTVLENDFEFKIKGIHKFWAFKNKIIIRKENIVSASQNNEEFTNWKGWRMPGTELPWVITAGTFIKKGKRNFWDVYKKKNAITIQLQNSSYNKLIIEVENPEETMQILNNK
jgi:hypothetical protein